MTLNEVIKRMNREWLKGTIKNDHLWGRRKQYCCVSVGQKQGSLKNSAAIYLQTF